VTLWFVFYLLLLLGGATYGLIIFNSLTTPLRLLVVLLLITFCSEFVSRILWLTIQNTMPCYHALMFIQFILYAGIFANDEYLIRWRTRIYLFAAVLALMGILNTLYVQPLLKFPSITLFGLTYFVVFCSLCTFTAMITNPKDIPLVRVPAFWFCFGNLVFYCVTFVKFGLANILQFNMPAWAHIVCNSVIYILYMSYLWAIVAGHRLSLSSAKQSV
jgi:hypothetical protein